MSLIFSVSTILKNSLFLRYQLSWSFPFLPYEPRDQLIPFLPNGFLTTGYLANGLNWMNIRCLSVYFVTPVPFLKHMRLWCFAIFKTHIVILKHYSLTFFIIPKVKMLLFE